MNKIQEALKLALDMLKQNDEFLYLFHECESEEEIDQYTLIRKRNENAIAFAEKALAEQPAQQIKQGWDVDDLLGKSKQPAQQEPMALDAIYAAWHGAGVDIAGGNWNRFIEMLPPLYTSPPASKPWVGLTDEEIDEGLLKSHYALMTAIAWRKGVEWAEAKLREKNA